jgi:GntR family transcriptional regulator/MocR family aminotransferase
VPRESTALPGIGLALDRDVTMPMYQQLYNQLRWSIEAGQLQPGARLPATRTLSAELGVSRNTVFVAYERLLMEGYLEGRVGSGTRVAFGHPRTMFAEKAGKNAAGSHTVGTTSASSAASANAANAADPTAAAPERAPRKMPRSAARVLAASRLLDAGHERLRYPDRPFTLGVPALDLFPTKAWSRVLAHRAEQLTVISYAHRDPAGYWPLRKEIAALVGLMRGIRCTADQVMICSSAQVAVHLAAMMLLERGEEALVENPGSLSNNAALMAAGIRAHPVAVDGDGMRIKSGATAHPRARMAVVTPNSQFPLGVRMSESRRSELMEWADAADGWILEDDYESEFWTAKPAAPLLQSDTSGRVIYIGTFSKVMYPAICLAYLVVPPDLVDVFMAAQRVMVRSLSITPQAALADFINTNHFARHIRQMRDVYGERGRVCADALKTHLGGAVQVDLPPSGMHLIARLPAGTDEAELASACRKARLRVYPLSAFYDGEPGEDKGLVLGFGSASPPQIQAGAEQLAAVFQRTVRRGG